MIKTGEWKRRSAALLLAAGLVAGLAACGGGSSKDESPVAQAPAEPLPPQVELDISATPFDPADPQVDTAWRLGLAERSWRHVSCRPVAGQPGVTLCLYAHSWLMGNMLARASFALEAPLNLTIQGESKVAQGYDLRLSDLRRFTRQAAEACAGPDKPPAGTTCLNEWETYLKDTMLPALEQEAGTHALLAAARDNLPTIRHELLHGHYFASAPFRAAVRTFWNGLPDLARERVRTELSAYYNVNNDDLLVNEFQAFTLQPPGENVLIHFRKKYRCAMINHLTTQGVAPPAALMGLDVDTACKGESS